MTDTFILLAGLAGAALIIMQLLLYWLVQILTLPELEQGISRDCLLQHYRALRAHPYITAHQALAAARHKCTLAMCITNLTRLSQRH